ncbi:uncharacterized protein K02A2.6-like [Cydia pomonella]|uniref:uncharacterized protein K02A2.6-like n=1 Tax=Cydia pomonella TaxID=82600 RepID=UPI002ADDB7B0|nr:uncharacterized protein K02A2.6-like [Cydia pomonella]
MNSEQFDKFLTLQATQQKQISDILQLLLSQQQNATAAAPTPTTTNGTESPSFSNTNGNRNNVYNGFKSDKFNPDDTAVEKFIDYFETKCKLWGEDARNIQKELLFTCLSPEIFHEIKVALTPHFEDSTYADVRNKLMDLFRIKRTRYRALTDFWNCIRKENESMEHYANRLKEISKDCGYSDDLLERQLRDRFATGLNHEQLQIDLKQKWPDLQDIQEGKMKEVTFSQIFSVAQSRERAEGDTDTQANVNKIKRNSKSYQNTSPRKLRTHQCLRCGEPERHPLNQCTAKTHTCKQCNTPGHFEDCCIKSGKACLPNRNYKQTTFTKRNKLHKLKHDRSSSHSSQSSYSDVSGDETDIVCQISKTNSKDSKKIDVFINDIPCTMDWDPGSLYSIISTQFWARIGTPSLIKAPSLRAYGNTRLKPKGLTNVSVRIQNEERLLPVVVMKSADPMLFGLQWSEMFQMDFPKPVYSIKKTRQEAITLKQILDKHTTLFDGKLGKVKDYQVNIHIKPDAQPKHITARSIKFSMKKNIEVELDRLVEEGIITKVDPNMTPIQWATPTVNVVKTNGQIRICGDFRSTLNPVLITHAHPVPLFDQLRQSLAEGEKFSKIDLKDAYLQFEIEPESKQFLTISTHKGYYTYNRMPFGISTAPSIFQHYLDKLLEGLPNVAVYFDDIAVTGKNDKDHLETLRTVFERLEQAGLKVNLKKCTFLQPEVEYLGHTIDKNGVRPTKSKIEAISKSSPPTNAKELRSFLGLVNFYERFIPHLHSVCADLHTLTGNRMKWQWTNKEAEAFERAKLMIVHSKSLVAFNDKCPLYLACDASEKGVGAVLFHMRNNIEQPIAFASRKLRPAESEYSVIDREALAIFFGIRKFDQYLRGTKFTLVTDHKPLIHILGSQRNLPKLANNRLVRWALIIGSYDYDIKYTKGCNNLIADYLSRMPNPEELPSKSELKVHKIVARLQTDSIGDLALSETVIRDETRKDTTLKRITNLIKTGWREHQYSNDVKPYARKRDELSLENKIIMWQGRIVVPDTLRKPTLKYLHLGHPGISAMRALARFYVWWPTIEEDIDTHVKTCHKCQENRPNTSDLPIFSWSMPDQAWERIHVDFAGPFEGSYWLVLSDAFSKWIEIKPMTKITTTKLCDELDTIFTTFGLPQFLVSDNGPQFISKEFQDYCEKNGIKHIKSSPYHPRTNGLAERLVRTFKTRMSSSTKCLKKRLEHFLFAYRITPHSTTGKAPGQLMFGRQLNCLLDNARPSAKRSLQYRQIQANVNSADQTPNYRPGDAVYVRSREQPRWEPATVSRRTHRYSYVINTPVGVERRYHADHIRPRLPDLEESPAERTPMVPVTSSTPVLQANGSTVPCPGSEAGAESLAEVAPVCSPQNEAGTATAATPMAPRRSRRTIKPPRRLIDEMDV